MEQLAIRQTKYPKRQLRLAILAQARRAYRVK